MTNTPQYHDGRSALWSEIAPSLVQSSLTDFRSVNGGGRLAHWKLNEPSLRWFKSYLLMAAQGISKEECDILRNVGPTSVGSPVTVTVSAPDGKHLTVDIDYLLAAEEVSFLNRNIDFSAITTVCELGGGFGRTAHVLLSLFKLDTYIIIDLPETLELSRAYLSLVLPTDLYKVISFVCAGDVVKYPETTDLFIQIDGFQEMSETTILSYFNSLAQNSGSFYTCNPIGKYEAAIAGLLDSDLDVVKIAHTLGRSRGFVDPWNEADLSSARKQHVENYCPRGYINLISEPSRMRPYYEHALYKPSS
jgi:putative sugar O-methyltransferase